MMTKYTLVFAIKCNELAITREEFNKVDTGETDKRFYSQYGWDWNNEKWNDVGYEEYTSYYDNEVEDYKDSLEACIDAFCKVHNIEHNRSDITGDEEEILLNRIAADRLTVEQALKISKPFYWLYAYANGVDFEVRQEGK